MTKVQVETAHFQHYPDLDGGNAEETAFLMSMAEEALTYVRSFRWAPPISDSFMAFGIGKVLALFLVRFEQTIEGGPDDELWVVVGDLPSAYFVTEAAPDPAEALAAYCELMEDWADRVLEGRNLEGVYPIPVAPTQDHAKMLKDRVNMIRSRFIPMARAGEVNP